MHSLKASTALVTVVSVEPQGPLPGQPSNSPSDSDSTERPQLAKLFALVQQPPGFFQVYPE